MRFLSRSGAASSSEKTVCLEKVRVELSGRSLARRRAFFPAPERVRSLGRTPGLVAFGHVPPGRLRLLPPGGSAHRLRYLAIPGSTLGFALEDGFFLQAIVTRETAHQRTLRPIVEHPAHVFARNACHRGEVALGNFLPDEDAPLADVMAERLGEVQQRARNAPFHGEKVRG